MSSISPAPTPNTTLLRSTAIKRALPQHNNHKLRSLYYRPSQNFTRE